MTCCSTKKDIKQRQVELKKIQKEAISRVSQKQVGMSIPQHPLRVPSVQNTFNAQSDDYEVEDGVNAGSPVESIKRNDSLNALDFFPFPTTGERPNLEHPVTNKYVCGVKGTYRYVFYT